MTTGFCFDEHTLWHSTGEAALFLRPRGWIQPPAAGGWIQPPGRRNSAASPVLCQSVSSSKAKPVVIAGPRAT